MAPRQGRMHETQRRLLEVASPYSWDIIWMATVAASNRMVS